MRPTCPICAAPTKRGGANDWNGNRPPQRLYQTNKHLRESGWSVRRCENGHVWLEPSRRRQRDWRWLRILRTIDQLHHLKGRPPTYYEVMTKVGMHSTGTMSYNVAQLRAHGLLQNLPFSSRGLMLTPAGKAAVKEDDIQYD